MRSTVIRHWAYHHCRITPFGLIRPTGCANGVWVETQGPVGRAEYRSRSGMKARILSEADLTGAAELCEPPERRGTQGIGVADAGLGCPSLWVLSLGHARESTSPERAKPVQVIYPMSANGVREELPGPVGRAGYRRSDLPKGHNRAVGRNPTLGLSPLSDYALRANSTYGLRLPVRAAGAPSPTWPWRRQPMPAWRRS